MFGGTKVTAFVEVKNLNVKYGDKTVLNNVNLTIEEGETVGIIGRSGAGKTILLHVLRGLDEDIPASGSVIYPYGSLRFLWLYKPAVRCIKALSQMRRQDERLGRGYSPCR